MSKMFAVHAELCELGYYKIHNIEKRIINLKENPFIKEKEIIACIKQEYKITKDTAIMLVAGAGKHKSSTSIYTHENI